MVGRIVPWLAVAAFLVAVIGTQWLLDDGKFTPEDCFAATGDLYERCEAAGYR